MASSDCKVIFGIKNITGKDAQADRNLWTRIGVGFDNADGSINLNFDYLPTDKSITIQLREPNDKDG